MTIWTLVRRSLQFHARAHLGVLLGATVGSAALIGALIVGDSVRESLRERGLARLQQVHYALLSGDRFFRQDLGNRIEQLSSLKTNSYAVGLLLAGTAARPDSRARANHVQIFGVEAETWPKFAGWQSVLSSSLLQRWRAGDIVLLNEVLARQLAVKPGDEVILRVRKPSALALDAVITPRNDTSLAFRLVVGSVLPASLLGDFDLAVSQIPAGNAFLPLDFLSQKLELRGRANLLVYGPPPAGVESEWLDTQAERLNRAWSLDDVQLSIHPIESTDRDTKNEGIPPSIEITSSRVFLDSPVVNAALNQNVTPSLTDTRLTTTNQDNKLFSRSVTNGVRILTYLATLIRKGDRGTPYSMVTAADGPYIPAGMNDDEMIVNQWLAEDLQVKQGDQVELTYYVVDSGSRLVEHTNLFRIRKIVPLAGLYGDRSLMPDFPGIAKAESTHDWDTGFPLVYKIREKDEAYWKAYRGTPKAFITLAAGQSMWANRFGSLTSIRYELPTEILMGAFRQAVSHGLRAHLAPAEFGLRFQPVREQALKAAEQSQDFGQLFLGFSLFLIVAALLLTALLFQLGLEQRSAEIGTLLALGLTPKQVRRMLLFEGATLALIGGLVGAAGGWAYAKAMLWALTSVWKNAVGAFALVLQVKTLTLIAGILASTIVALLTLWLTLRKQARRPAYELLAGIISIPNSRKRSRGVWIGSASILVALVIVGWALASRQLANAEAFFGAGSLMLIGGLGFVSAWMALLGRSSGGTVAQLTDISLAVRGCGRRRKRTLATVALLACGCFVIVSIGAFRLDANRDAASRSSGTGGFALIGQSSLPVLQDLNTQSGRQSLGLNGRDLNGVEVVPFRVRQGDDASCLNLNRAQTPRLLGVRPEALRGRFSFAGVRQGADKKQGWALLKPDSFGGTTTSASEIEIPAIGDANSIEWALGKRLGDTIEYEDERGQKFKLRLVGAVANSILQGSLIIDEDAFVRRFPSESGYRFFLIDATPNSNPQVSASLSHALEDTGLELTPAVQRLNDFNAVQNTYLGTFQILGGLGLLMGSAGLGVVVLRNILERRGELALFMAVGFRRWALYRLVLVEHGALLALGLGLGIIAGAIAVLPSLLSSAVGLPYASLGVTLGAILINGAVWTWLATLFALRGNLLEALRNE